jgi:hypothetical protein
MIGDTPRWLTPQEYAAWAIDRWTDVNFDSDEGRRRLALLVARAFEDGRMAAERQRVNTLSVQVEKE